MFELLQLWTGESPLLLPFSSLLRADSSDLCCSVLVPISCYNALVRWSISTLQWKNLFSYNSYVIWISQLNWNRSLFLEEICRERLCVSWWNVPSPLRLCHIAWDIQWMSVKSERGLFSSILSTEEENNKNASVYFARSILFSSFLLLSCYLTTLRTCIWIRLPVAVLGAVLLRSYVLFAVIGFDFEAHFYMN